MNVLLVDDHALIRDAVRGVFVEIAPTTHLSEASTAEEALRNLSAARNFDVVVLDLGLPDRDGIEILKEIRTNYPAVGVAVLSGTADAVIMGQVLDLGAVGFIPKSSPRPVMLNAFRLILSGGVYIPPEAWAGSRGQMPTTRAVGPKPGDLGITERQLQVLALLMKGQSNKAIARSLSIAEVTVKHHVATLMRVLKAQNRTEAALAVAKLGWRLPS